MLRVIHADIWQVFDADPNACVLHGVTKDKPASSGFAATVVQRLGPMAVQFHYGAEGGDVRWYPNSRIAAGVTQREYRQAQPELITQVIYSASRAFDPNSKRKLLVPFIGAGLGGLGAETALRAIVVGAESGSLEVILCLMPY